MQHRGEPQGVIFIDYIPSESEPISQYRQWEINCDMRFPWMTTPAHIYQTGVSEAPHSDVMQWVFRDPIEAWYTAKRDEILKFIAEGRVSASMSGIEYYDKPWEEQPEEYKDYMRRTYYASVYANAP